jgi:putative glycosyltransferase (TIGR04348 family)
LAKQHIVIISPASAKANNGNWQTANRWARFLRARYKVTFAPAADDLPADLVSPDAIIALHARRSAPALAAFAVKYPALPSVLVLTGTDLYRDIRTDRDAQRSLQLATRMVVLQDAGLHELSDDLRAKTRVVYQSAPTLVPSARKLHARHFDVVMVGHLRDEKDPLTFMRAAALVTTPRVRTTHIGGALDPALAAQAEATQRMQPRYRWLGNLAHGATRQRLKRSHLMVIASRMEGGANVIIEAVTSGVPVLASDISGNRGMLGDDYAGYFPLGDQRALAQLIDRAASDNIFYDQLVRQCAARAALFAPACEQAAVLQLVDNLLNNSRDLRDSHDTQE